MGFEWDEDKRERNLQDHKIDFPTVTDLFDDPRKVVFSDDRKDYGERRYILLGFLRQKLYQVVFTWCGENIRIISARRAKRREKRIYDRLKNR